MAKQALLVGVDHYLNFDELHCCVRDAKKMEELLSHHADGSDNFACSTLLSTPGELVVTEASLRAALRKLTREATKDDDLLFYFSGHGMVLDGEGALVTQNAIPDDVGFPMYELLRLVNRCGAGSMMVILDCCHSGEMGNTGDAKDVHQATLSEGVTILSASGVDEASEQGIFNSLFTELVCAALEGGGADIRGYVSAASVYAYVERAMGPWQQRPLYKSYAKTLKPLRLCQPIAADEDLHRLPELFRGPTAPLQLDPSWEHSEGNDPENVRKFNVLKKLRNGSLLATEDDMDLYYLALNSKTARLTPLGRLYWKLARRGEFQNDPNQNDPNKDGEKE